MCDKTLDDASCHGNYVCCYDDEPSNQVKVTPTQVLHDDEEELEDEEISIETDTSCHGVCITKDLATEVCSGVEEKGACPRGSVCCIKNSTVAMVTKERRKCGGTCRSMIFGLFLCDEIDSEAECEEGHQACCIMKIRPEGAGPRPQLPGPQGGGVRPDTRPQQPWQRPQMPQPWEEENEKEEELGEGEELQEEEHEKAVVR